MWTIEQYQQVWPSYYFSHAFVVAVVVQIGSEFTQKYSVLQTSRILFSVITIVLGRCFQQCWHKL